LMHAATT